MGQVDWTHEAERWLSDIHDFIARDDPGAALRIVTSIYERAQILASYPEIGYRHGEGEGREIRILLYGHYRIAYLIKHNRDVDILGVFHGALDLDRYL